jgi:hypothetical protein
MSHAAIAAALALPDVPTGERLAAFSLASFANSEHRAWPGTRVAAARAGLSHSQYLAARAGLEQRELILVEAPGGGRGNSPLVALRFAERGPWFDGEINARLFERTLGYTRASGAARLLLGTLAALADDAGQVADLSTDDLRAATGMADSTYRHAQRALRAAGELSLLAAGGGRGRKNRWQLHDPSSGTAVPVIAPRDRPGPTAGARPLVATVKKALRQPPALKHPITRPTSCARTVRN